MSESVHYGQVNAAGSLAILPTLKKKRSLGKKSKFSRCNAIS